MEKELREIQELYESLKGNLTVTLDDYLKNVLSELKERIEEDSFQNCFLKKVRESLPEYPSFLRVSGSDNEVLVLNVPEEKYWIVHDLIKDIRNILNKDDRFYMGVHIVNEEDTMSHYKKYIDKNV